MPRFYFDTHDNDLELRDDVGLDLPDLQAAKTQAALTLAQVAVDALPKAGLLEKFAIHVHDEARRLALKATLTFEAEFLD